MSAQMDGLEFWAQPGKVEELKRLWDEGLSARKIADSLGCTKSAVIGKAARLNLGHRPSPLKYKRQLKQKLTPPLPSPKVERVAVANCRWPTGDTMPFVPCGAPVVPGKPYCRVHCALAYRPTPPPNPRW